MRAIGADEPDRQGGREGERGSALLMWNMQTIQSTRVLAGTGWQPFEKKHTVGMILIPVHHKAVHQLIFAVLSFLILSPISIVNRYAITG